jgi:hypothetical protein
MASLIPARTGIADGKGIWLFCGLTYRGLVEYIPTGRKRGFEK